MRVTKIKSRGYLFAFDDLHTTNVYVIEAAERRFVCDTFLGPEPMHRILEHMNQRFGEKQVYAFNSHGDWDHVWGNSVFGSSWIISHESTVSAILRDSETSLSKYAHMQKGCVHITLPGILFGSTLEFRSEQVVFFHSPGHTAESSSCYDALDNVLFAGDNVEEPTPYVQWHDIATYLKTLSVYEEMQPSLVIPGHGSPDGMALVRKNRDYLEDLMSRR